MVGSLHNYGKNICYNYGYDIWLYFTENLTKQVCHHCLVSGVTRTNVHEDSREDYCCFFLLVFESCA